MTASADHRTMSVTRIAGVLGAEIRGLDLTGPLDPGRVSALRQAVLDHKVVYLREQLFSIPSIERLGLALGGLESKPYLPGLDGHPGVVRVVKEPHERLNFGNTWHSDWSFEASPPAFTVLWAVDVPPIGGDTLWSNQELPLQRLSKGFRQHLAGLRAIHSSEHVYGPQGELIRTAGDRTMQFVAGEVMASSHPVIARHPETGRAALFVNPVYTTGIEGWNGKESRALLDYLFACCEPSEYTFRLRWEAGTVAIWDNRSTWHLALNDYQGQRREPVPGHRAESPAGRPGAVDLTRFTVA